MVTQSSLFRSPPHQTFRQLHHDRITRTNDGERMQATARMASVVSSALVVLGLKLVSMTLRIRCGYV